VPNLSPTKVIDPSIAEWNWILFSRDTFHNISDLTTRPIEANSFHVIVGVDVVVINEPAHQTLHGVLKCRASCYDDAERNRSIGVQAFEVFQITVEKGIFVVPLDFERDRSCLECSDVVDFMRLSLSLHAVNDPLNNEIVFSPAMFRERIAQPLGAIGLSAPPNQ
jgi:hypothetical protein